MREEEEGEGGATSQKVNESESSTNHRWLWLWRGIQSRDPLEETPPTGGGVPAGPSPYLETTSWLALAQETHIHTHQEQQFRAVQSSHPWWPSPAFHQTHLVCRSITAGPSHRATQQQQQPT